MGVAVDGGYLANGSTLSALSAAAIRGSALGVYIPKLQHALITLNIEKLKAQSRSVRCQILALDDNWIKLHVVLTSLLHVRIT